MMMMVVWWSTHLEPIHYLPWWETAIGIGITSRTGEWYHQHASIARAAPASHSQNTQNTENINEQNQTATAFRLIAHVLEPKYEEGGGKQYWFIFLFNLPTIASYTVTYSLYAEPYWETDERKMTETDKERRKEEQEIFFNGDFKTYLNESAEEGEDFLTKLVQCATGSNYLPYDSLFNIYIEFNLSR